MDDETLLSRTIYHVQNRHPSVTYTQLAEAIGTSYHWIEKFAKGKIPDPSVNRVQALYEYLTQSKLELR